jgi:hypothetical protein
LSLFYFISTNLQCIKEEEAPELIIAYTGILLEYLWNIRGILRYCPFAPKIMAEEEEDRKKEEVKIIEEKQFMRNGSA